VSETCTKGDQTGSEKRIRLPYKLSQGSKNTYFYVGPRAAKSQKGGEHRRAEGTPKTANFTLETSLPRLRGTG